MNCLFTIDVEAHFGENGFDNLILGKIGKNYFGVPKILNILKKLNINAIFFIDFAAIDKWGIDNYKTLCKQIIDSGNDIQLHLHPTHLTGGSDFLFDYSFDDQKELIGEVINRYDGILGFKPKAFRAGRYGANDDTINVLSHFDINYDFSYYHNHPWCKISKTSYANKIVKRANVTMVPVSVIMENLIFKKKLTKYDIEYISSFANKMIIKEIVKNPNMFFTLFAHSWSMLNRLDNYSKIEASSMKKNHFYNMLKTLKQNDIKFLSIKDLEIRTQQIVDNYLIQCNPIQSVHSFLRRNLNLALMKRRMSSIL
jgi:peptidoglycan/xylan/chitin deacetylase (PgdA/CDA1 family)